jgi:hypothetical protein
MVQGRVWAKGDTMKTVKLAGGAVALAVLMTAWMGTAEAKRARCYTSDDGYYSCNFKGIDDAGSFRVSAPGYPTFTLEISSPGFAYGYADYGSGNVSLPGRYVRSRDDGACWNNPDTSTKICAW